MGVYVSCRASRQCHVLPRRELQRRLADAGAAGYARMLLGPGGSPWKAAIFNAVHRIAVHYQQQHPEWKADDVITWEWAAAGGRDAWRRRQINTRPLAQRTGLMCIVHDVYNLPKAPARALIVDFANRRVGGGCFGPRGFVQEEQMVAQSTDLALRISARKDTIAEDSAITFDGVYFDAWWGRDAAMRKEGMTPQDVQPAPSKSLTVAAIDAPNVSGQKMYDAQSLWMLVQKTALVFDIAAQMRSPSVYSGLLGGGAFRNNRPLALLLHMLFQPVSSHVPLMFYAPIFSSFDHRPAAELEQLLVPRAEWLMEQLHARGAATLGDAFDELMRLAKEGKLPLSEGDADLKK